MSVTMIAVFVAALTIPEAYGDLPGGWHGPLVLAVAYTLVRIIHLVLYMLAAGDDAGLRRQILLPEAVAMAPAAARRRSEVLHIGERRRGVGSLHEDGEARHREDREGIRIGVA